MTLGESLLLARRRAGLSQGALAKAIGVSAAFLSMIEHNQKPFPPDRLAGLPPTIREAVTEAMVIQLETGITRAEDEIARLRAESGHDAPIPRGT